MDAGEADAEVVVERLAHAGDHVFDEAHAAAPPLHEAGEAGANFEDDGDGEGIVFCSTCDDGVAGDGGLDSAASLLLCAPDELFSSGHPEGVADAAEDGGDGEKDDGWKAGNKAHEEDDAGG